MIYASKNSQSIKAYAKIHEWSKPKLIRKLQKLKEGDVYLIDILSDIPIQEARSLLQRGVRIISVMADISVTEAVLDASILLGYEQPKREKKSREEEFHSLKEDLGVAGYYDQLGIWREEDYVPPETSIELNDDEQLVYWQENSICSKWIDTKILEAWQEARICRELVFLRKLLPYVFCNHRGSKISLLYVHRRIKQITQ